MLFQDWGETLKKRWPLSACIFMFMAFFAAAQTPHLAWEKGHSERKTWSQEFLNQFAAQLPAFDRAKDIALYCPRYSSLPAAERIYVLATIAVAIAKFESNFNPKQHFGEPPPLGYDSIGLFQLSYEDRFPWCTMDRASKSLEDPVTNIQCAVPEMGRLVASDEIIAAGKTSTDARGLARYWSVLREGPKHHLQAIRTSSNSLAICQ